MGDGDAKNEPETPAPESEDGSSDKNEFLEEGLPTKFPLVVNVNFNFSLEGTHPVSLQAQFKHIQPENWRMWWRSWPEDLAKLVSRNTVSLEKHFILEGQETFTRKISYASAIMCVYCNPNIHLFAPIMDAIINYVSWTHILHDLVDNNTRYGVRYTDLVKATLYFTEIMEGKHDSDFGICCTGKEVKSKLPKLKTIPIFPRLVIALLGIRRHLKNYIRDFDSRSKHVIRAMEETMQAMEWSIVGKMDKRYNLITVRRWRSYKGSGKFIIELFSLANDITVNEDIRGHVIFQTYSNLAANLMAFTYDAICMQKDYLSGKMGNTALYRVVFDGIDPQVALDEQVLDLAERLSDLMQLRIVALKAWPEDEGILKMLNHVETCVHGQWMIYIKSPEFEKTHKISIEEMGLTQVDQICPIRWG